MRWIAGPVRFQRLKENRRRGSPPRERSPCFALAHHFHEALLDSVGRFGRAQAESEGLVQPVTFGDEVFRFLTERARASSNSRLSPFSRAPMT